jgi:hypothetical protein
MALLGVAALAVSTADSSSSAHHQATAAPSPPLPPVPPLCDLRSCGPLRVSASGRFLVHRDGRTPFYYVADTPWHLLQDVSLAEAMQFIDIRLRQGFTALQLNALGMGDDPNAQGDRFGNWTALNPLYWAHVDAVLKYMEQRGMVAYILPIWAFNWACPGPHACPSGRPSATLSDHYDFGRTLGARWRSYGNVIWVLGGDISNPPVAKYRQLLAGIRAGGAQQLLTAHPRAPGSSSAFLPTELDFFSVQNRAGRSGGGGTPTTGELTRQDALATFPAARGGSGRVHKPVLMVETWYEDWGDGGVADLQLKRGPMLRDAYWGARLSGSLGEGYGDWGSWLASKAGSYNIGGPCKTPGWHRDVQLPGAIDIALHMRTILTTVPWAALSPDGHDVDDVAGSPRVVSRIGAGNASALPLYVAHTLSAAGAGPPVVVVYVRGAQAFSLLHAADTLGDVVVASYYDPSGGEQAHSTAFPVLRKELNATPAAAGTGDNATIVVPAQPWEGDGVVILRAAATSDVILPLSHGGQE